MKRLLNILMLLALPACLAGCETGGLAETTATVPQEIPKVTDGIAIDLDRLSFDNTRTDLFRSSVFLNPRSIESARLYLADFQNHHAARLYGAFEYVLMQANDIESFKEKLEERRDYLNTMSRVHKVFIITVTLMPQWLSSSSDPQAIEGYWRHYHTYHPSDYAKWNEIVAAAAVFFRDFEQVERYYEIWNEPDTSYWHDDIDHYLELYRQTALTLKQIDPQAKVGGASVNSWNGRVQRNPDRDMLTIELIRYAHRHDLPLDFISWHHFGSFAGSLIGKAKRSYEQECRQLGFKNLPEFVVSEWNNVSKYRGIQESAALAADTFYDLYEAGVDLQTFAAWEDFVPNRDQSGYGLISQKLEKKNVYHIHRMFHELATRSEGIAIMTVPSSYRRQGDRRLVISREQDDTMTIAVWSTGYSAAGAAAIDYLLQQQVPREVILNYSSMLDLEHALRHGRTESAAYAGLFKKASEIYRRHENEDTRLKLLFTGADRVEVIRALSVSSTKRDKPTDVRGNTLSCDLAPFEVLLLQVTLNQKRKES